jgi:hypothetical protein
MGDSDLVSREVLARRLDACTACSHNREPPEGANPGPHTGRTDIRICALSGSVIAKKARIAYENCPDRSEDNPALSRWGEPIVRY